MSLGANLRRDGLCERLLRRRSATLGLLRPLQLRRLRVPRNSKSTRQLIQERLGYMG